MAENQPWYESEFGGEFWLAISASCFAFMGLALRACLKSRCSKIKICWGFWECGRDPVADEFSELEVQRSENTISTPKSTTLEMEEGRL